MSLPKLAKPAGRSSKGRSGTGKTESLELVIDDVAMTGEGVAHLPNGDAVFVKGTIAGERILADVGAGRPRRGTLLQLLEPSATRVVPPCPEVVRCGGCDFMHLSAFAREDWHRRHATRALSSALTKLGVELPAPTYHAPLRELGYRMRARLHIVGNGSIVRVGYRGARSHELVAVSACAVLSPELAPVLQTLPAILAGARGEGEATVAVGRDNAPVFDLHWVGTLADSTFRALDAALGAHRLAGARIWLDRAREPLVAGDPRPVVLAADGQELTIAAGGFAQASDDAGAALARRVAELARATKPAKAVELFAGSGTLTVMLAREVGQLTAIERDEPAVLALRENLRQRGLDVRVRLADVDTVELAKVDLVVLDPPRGGAAKVVANLVKSRPKRIIYVSCNALTLARDLAVLVADRYRIEALDLFELFPQTSHVEVVCSLVR